MYKQLICSFFRKSFPGAFIFVIFMGAFFPDRAEAYQGSRDKQPTGYEINVPDGYPLAMRAAERLQSYLGKTSGQAPGITENTLIQKRQARETTIVIGPEDSFVNLDDFSLADDLAKISGEGYILKSVSLNGSNYIFALGKSERGASNAVWHLMRELGINHGRLPHSSFSVIQNPFIETREVTFVRPWVREGHKGIGEMNQSLYEKYQVQYWEKARLQNYVNLIDGFGYDAIQLTDVWFFRDYFKALGYEPERWTERIIAMAGEVHKNGQTYAQFVYGSSVKDHRRDKNYTYPGACFNDPHEKQALLTEYDYLARLYGPHADRIVTHWSDWGGQPDCDKCTIETAMEQHNIMLEKFRAHNPGVTSGFSLWNVIPGIWPGYDDDNSILDPGILSKQDVAVTMDIKFGKFANGHFKVGESSVPRARNIMNKGYKPAVWMWRTLDIESWHGLHVHTELLENYFKSIPADIAEALVFHSVDNISQYLALSNQYIAAQLMWDPYQSGAQLLREFTGLMFGADDRLILLREARKRLEKVKISPDFVPVFPVIIEPGALIKEIGAHLMTMIQYAEFQSGAKKLMATYPLPVSSEDRDEVKIAIVALPVVPAPEEYLWVHTYSRYRIDYNALVRIYQEE